MDAFESFLLLLPSGAGGHHDDLDRLRADAALHQYEGWIFGCRDRCDRRSASRGRLQIVVTLLAIVGTPVGTIAAALAAASALDGVDYVLVPPDEP